MTYFITGGTGLVGQYLIKELINEGHQVIALKRNHSIIPSILKSHSETTLKWINGDLLDSFSYQDFLTPQTTVIHTAAMVSFQPSDDQAMFKTNVEGTIQVINSSLSKKVKKFIHISSVASIGRIKGIELIDENIKWQDSPDNSSYAISKYYSELEVWRGFEEGLNGFIINPSIILSQSDWNKSSSVIFKRIAKGTSFYPKGNVNTVDLRDVIKAIFLLDKKNVNHERYICNGNFTSYKKLFSVTANAFNKKVPSIALSTTLLKLLAYVSGLISIFSKNPLITIQSVKSLSSKNEFISTKLIKELDFTYRPLDETIQWTAPYYVEKYKL